MKREYLPRLAREHGITEEFCSAVKVLHLHPRTSIFIGQAVRSSAAFRPNSTSLPQRIGVALGLSHLIYRKSRRAPQWMISSAWLIWTLG